MLRPRKAPRIRRGAADSEGEYSSKSEADITGSYDRYANAYIPRPVDLNGLSKVVRSLDEFWFEVVRLPENE